MLRIETRGGAVVIMGMNSKYHVLGGMSWLAEDFLGFQEWFSNMGLDKHSVSLV